MLFLACAPSSQADEVDVPDPTLVIQACTPERVGRELADCINQLVYRAPKEGRKITILPRPRGEAYEMTAPLFIFERHNITITGPPSGPRPTLIVSLPTDHRPEYARFFMIHLVNASDVTISRLTLDGGSDGDPRRPYYNAVRGIALCPMSRPDRTVTIRNIAVIDNYVRNFGGYFALLGAAYGDRLTLSDTELVGRFIAGEAAQMDFLRYLHGFGGRMDLRQCIGAMRDIRFERNHFDLQSVALFLIPATRKATEEIEVGALSDATRRSWASVASAVAAATSRIIIRNNQFRIDTKAMGRLRFEEQESTLHSILKVHNASQVAIEGNLFDLRYPESNSLPQATGHAQCACRSRAGSTCPLPERGVTCPARATLGQGAAVNIATGITDLRLANNVFLFPQRHFSVKEWASSNAGSAVALFSGFSVHKDFGIGRGFGPDCSGNQFTLTDGTGRPSERQLQDCGLTVPVRRITIEGNSFVNSTIRVSAPCGTRNPRFSGSIRRALCRELDDERYTGTDLDDAISIRCNRDTVRGPVVSDQSALVVFDSNLPPYKARAEACLRGEESYHCARRNVRVRYGGSVCS